MAVAETKKRQLKGIKRCGDFGGEGRDGKPCGRRVKDGLCRSHSEAGAAETGVKKAAFLEEYSKGTPSLKAAAETCGAAAVTVWRWRQEDEEFNAALTAVQANLDKIRLNMVEDTLVERCLKPDTPAALVIFYLVNRSDGRWRNVQQVQQQNVNFDFDLSNLTEEELERVQNGEHPLRVLAQTRGPHRLAEGT